MKFIKSIFMFGALAMAAGFATSCSDDDEYDFPGDANNRVFTKDCSGNYAIVQTPIGAIGAMKVVVQARCNQKAAGDIKVRLAVDNSLIEAYNEENGTNYQPLPAEALVIENQEMTIPSGELICPDSTATVIALTEDAAVLATLTDMNGYLVPVVMESVNGGGAAAATSVKSQSWLVIGVSENIVDDDATQETRKGTLVSDRSGWTVTGLDGTEATTDWYGDGGDPAAWFDGDSNNSCVFSNSSGGPAVVVVDLGKEYKVDGILGKYRLYSYYDAGLFQSGMKVYYSSDNSTWNDMTEIGSTSWLGKDFIGLYGPVPMRYIKLELPKTSSWSDPEIQCGDFNVYASN